MENVILTGEREMKAVFDKLAREYPAKVIAKGLRQASKPFTKAVKATASPGQKKVVKVKVYTKTKQPLIFVGLSASRKSYIPEWFKYYWQNYGTLANRDTTHKFLYARKRKTRHYSGGIKAAKSFEKAWESTKSQTVSAIVSEMTKAAREYENKIKKL